MCGPGEVLCQGGSIPSNWNVETRSIAPDEVKIGGKLIEWYGIVEFNVPLDTV